MGIFSDGQFDVMRQWYVFEPKAKRFKKVEGDIPRYALALYFTAVPEKPEDFSSGSRGFSLTLFDYDKTLDKSIKFVEKVKGVIDRKGPNTDYYNKVNYMRRRATEIIEKEKQKIIDARTVVG
jgi:hypothetical protein